ncbi:MAG: prolyl-tRNA synthetase associated domain-containing protein [Pseudomonadota bacterium]
MSITRAGLFAALDALGIEHETVDHPAIFTVEEGRGFKSAMKGGHSKNLFLKDKKGGLALAVAWCDTAADLVGLGKALGAQGRYSFAKPDLMAETLGVAPGSATPFALLNAQRGALKHVAVDSALLRFDQVWFHPLENTASTAISPTDLLRFVQRCGVAPAIIDFADPRPTSGA